MSKIDLDKQMEKSMEETIFVDCAVLDNDYYAVIAEKDMGDDYVPWSMLPPVKIFAYADEDNPYWGGHKFGKNTFKYPKACHTQTEGEMLVVDQNGEVWYHGLGKNKHFEKNGIPPDLAYHIGDLKNIHGTIYACGVHRSVVRRVGNDQWESITVELHAQTKVLYDQAQEKGSYLHNGFHCIDGFKQDRDLYVAGGNGDVWRFDGKDWHPIDIPLPKMQIKKICCAEDGYVYITGRFGVILKGREDSWRVIEHKGKTEFNDIASYKGKIYVASSSRLYEIVDDKTQLVRYGQKLIPRNHGHLYVNHDLLMTAGRSSAAVFDGENWKVLYGGAGLDEETAGKIVNKVMSGIANEETK